MARQIHDGSPPAKRLATFEYPQEHSAVKIRRFERCDRGVRRGLVRPARLHRFRYKDHTIDFARLQ